MESEIPPKIQMASSNIKTSSLIKIKKIEVESVTRSREENSRIL